MLEKYWLRGDYEERSHFLWSSVFEPSGRTGYMSGISCTFEEV
jgi:hypothetical protein